MLSLYGSQTFVPLMNPERRIQSVQTPPAPPSRPKNMDNLRKLLPSLISTTVCLHMTHKMPTHSGYI